MDRVTLCPRQSTAFFRQKTSKFFHVTQVNSNVDFSVSLIVCILMEMILGHVTRFIQNNVFLKKYFVQ